MRSKILIFAVCGIVLGSFVAPSSANRIKNKKVSGESVYKTHCASCHGAGGNLVSDKHPIAGSKELSTLAQFKQYLNSPPGHMPHYAALVANDESLKALYEYVKSIKKPLRQATLPPQM
jgi:mono/diheme cytochrome c family protein